MTAAIARSARARRRAGPGRGALWTALLAAIALAGLAVAGVLAMSVVADKAANGRIRALAAGRDVAVAADDRPAVLLARAQFLLQRGFVDEAEALRDPIDATGRRDLLAAFLKDLGAARLRRAFEGIERQDLDAAIPEVRLAKDAFRQALELAPDDFDLKVDLDLAMRLVRDFPELDQGEPEEAPEQPKTLWTELPGVPEGLP